MADVDGLLYEIDKACDADPDMNFATVSADKADWRALTARIAELEAGLTKILDTRKGHILGGCDTDADRIEGYSRIVNVIWDTAAAAMKGGNDAERA